MLFLVQMITRIRFWPKKAHFVILSQIVRSSFTFLPRFAERDGDFLLQSYYFWVGGKIQVVWKYGVKLYIQRLKRPTIQQQRYCDICTTKVVPKSESCLLLKFKCCERKSLGSPKTQKRTFCTVSVLVNKAIPHIGLPSP